MSGRPKLYGAAYSTYVRTVRLTLEEKGVAYDLVEIDVFAPGGPPSEYLQINPFGRIPAFEHEAFRMYEALPIARYIDEAFPGPALQPSEIRCRARMNQILGVLDSYAYRTLVWDIYVERTSPTRGKPSDEKRITDALPRAQRCLSAIEQLMGAGAWLAGDTLSLADLHAAPMFDYFLRTPDGRDMLGARSTLRDWWDRIASLPSLITTRA